MKKKNYEKITHQDNKTDSWKINEDGTRFIPQGLFKIEKKEEVWLTYFGVDDALHESGFSHNLRLIIHFPQHRKRKPEKKNQRGLR